MTEERLEANLTSTDPYVRRAAIALGDLNPEQRERALTDKNPDVRRAAMYESKYGGVPRIAHIDSAILAAIDGGKRLDMSQWHCGTTHCRAGWAIHLAGEAGYELERILGSQEAGAAIYRRSRPGKPIPNFFTSNVVALRDLRECAAACS